MDITLVPIVGSIVNNDPTIYFGERVIIISRDAAKLMGLDAGDRIMVAQDRSRADNLYIKKSSYGMTLKRVNQRLIAHSRKISRAVKQILGVNGGSARYIVEPAQEVNGEMVYPIFTRKNLIE